MIPVTSWGRLHALPHEVVNLHDSQRVAVQIGAGATGLAHGNGRSYGDVCLNPGGLLWRTLGLDRFIDFDPLSGRLACEAGVLLRDIQQLVIPQGWILPVTPGTQLVTVGGAIANDVHGKNHHVRGSFGDHVRSLCLVRTNGEWIECGPDHRPDWFAATVGGLGLTGVIVRAEIQLCRVHGPWLEAQTLPYASLAEFFTLADASDSEWEHTVSWIDCLSGGNARGLFMRANPTAVKQGPAPSVRQWTMPLVPPVSLVNAWSLRLFNAAYYQMGRRKTDRSLVHYTSFFYPLDHVLEWNRMYGLRGFYQYQSVIPRTTGPDATQSMLDEIARLGAGSFLAVLKTFGERKSAGMLGFPRPGVTLALDFPNQGDKTLRLLERLDDIVRQAGGCVYPAKDARMPRAMFEAGYARLAEFMYYRDPGISSGFSRRLMGS